METTRLTWKYQGFELSNERGHECWGLFLDDNEKIAAVCKLSIYNKEKGKMPPQMAFLHKREYKELLPWAELALQIDGPALFALSADGIKTAAFSDVCDFRTA